MGKATIGIDFGTESARAILIDTKTGKELANSFSAYTHGVLTEKLPNGVKLERNWAVQVPEDYFVSLKKVISDVIKISKIEVSDVVGIGIDFTASTIVGLDEYLNPLNENEKHKNNPYAFVKLWKHHAAQKYADEINKQANIDKELFLKRYGGKISSEWLFPKVLQDIRESYETFDDINIYMEVGDWIVSKLTGNLVRSTNTSGFKALWHHQEGYPSNEFLKRVDPSFENFIKTKLRGDIKSIGEKAGYLTEEYSNYLGLSTNTAVAINIIDAHAANAAVGAINEGDFVMALGTSTCHMLLSKNEVSVEGIAGYVKNGIIPGFYSYETGQAAVGDIFSWFVNNLVNQEISDSANQKKISIFQELENRSKNYKVGEDSLIALDWWNGNRSDLNDSKLSGMLVGLNLNTKPEQIYKALLESTAFGTRLIMENYLDKEIPVNNIYACGGLPKKSEYLVQIYSDILNRPIYIAKSKENTALGAAIYGAVAAGSEAGGYDHVNFAVKHMSSIEDNVIYPNEKNVLVYNKLFKIYKVLHDIFGVQEKEIMHNINS